MSNIISVDFTPPSFWDKIQKELNTGVDYVSTQAQAIKDWLSVPDNVDDLIFFTCSGVIYGALVAVTHGVMVPMMVFVVPSCVMTGTSLARMLRSTGII